MRTVSSTLRNLALTSRPWQWVKNSFVVAPLVFSKYPLSVGLGIRFAAGFFVFCAFSSAVYTLNDLADRERDRLHPLKRNRPLASGALHPVPAWANFALLVIVGAVLGYRLNRLFFLVGLAYLALNLAYSFVLKKRVLLDAISVALGFVLRVIAGAILVQVIPTAWILLSTFFLALFLSFGKRRGEIAHLDRDSYDKNTALMQYTPQFLDSVIMVVSACTIMCYSLFSLSTYATEKFGSPYLIVTVPFVIFGIFRYFHLLYNEKKGEDPTSALLTDIPLQLSVIGWLLTFAVIIYLPLIPVKW